MSPIGKTTIANEIVKGSGGHNPLKQKAIERLKQQHDEEWLLCAKHFWYFCSFVITEDEDLKKQRAFPLNFDYLYKLHDEVEAHQKTIILKSRRLLVSWYGMLRQLHGAMFAGTPGGEQVFRGGVMSIGETEAEYLIQRISRAYKRLPQWMKDRNPLRKDNNMYLEFAAHGTVQAFPLKREGPQTFGFSEVFFDEMALQEAVRTVWTGLIPTLGAEGKLLAVSTPNGRLNLFYDIWSNKNDQYKDIHRIKLHWSENPEHDEKWFQQATVGMDSQMVARMFELSFAAYYGQPVFAKEFNAQMHIAEEVPEIMTGFSICLGWDLGYNRPAAVFAQRNSSRDQWIVHGCYVRNDISFDKFCQQVKEWLATFIDFRTARIIHFMPPDARFRYRNRAQSGAVNDYSQVRITFARGQIPPQIYFSPGEVGTRDNEGPRLKHLRSALLMRKDREPGLYLSPENTEELQDGFKGGYCYDEKRRTEQPMKNEYSDPMDALQAIVSGWQTVMNIMSPSGEQQTFKRRQRIGRRTGL